MSVFEALRLRIEVDTSVDPALVVWKGDSDARDPASVVQPFLKELVGRLKSKDVTIRFDELTYMNSATVKPIMLFVEALSPVAGKIRVEYSQSVPWQATSFRAMRIVAERKWHNVEVVGI